jgi:hypothetical protein
MSAFTLLSSRGASTAPQILRGNKPPRPAASHETIRAKRNHAYHSLLSGKRFDATEDRDYDRSAFAGRLRIEIMHPSSLSRERAQENKNRPGICLAIIDSV